jgi:triphosphoribosyl-dephospho-CoA synthase
MNSSPPSPAEALAAALVAGLRAELHLTPKPGLVDRRDSGSHPDLSLATMEASLRLLELYLRQLLAALPAGAGREALVTVGRRAEDRMFRELGTNTHKGGIFLCGLLVTARFHTAGDQPQHLRRAVAELAAEFFAAAPPAASNGARVRERFGRGGIVAEALAGLPSLFEVALPAWEEGFALAGDETLTDFFVLARLMQTVDDTTAMHRCGETGLARLRRDGRRIEARIAAGHDPFPLLTALNDDYRAMHLTMGGVADLFGVAAGYRIYRRSAVPFRFQPQVAVR